MTSYVIVGRVRTAHGIRGQVTVEVLTDAPDAIFAPGRRVFAGTTEGDLARDPVDRCNPESRQALQIQERTPFKDGLIIKFDAIPDRTEAERWRQRYLLVPSEEIRPPADDEVFVHELIEMRVQDREGAVWGTVTGTYELPQGLTLEVTTERGEVLIPYRPDVVLEVDLDARVVVVDPASGWFDVE